MKLNTKKSNTEQRSIKFDKFTLNYKPYNDFSYEVNFTDTTYRRGLGYTTTVNNVNFKSSSCPQFTESTIYLPGTTSDRDEDKIYIPRSIIFKLGGGSIEDKYSYHIHFEDEERNGVYQCNNINSIFNFSLKNTVTFIVLNWRKFTEKDLENLVLLEKLSIKSNLENGKIVIDLSKCERTGMGDNFPMHIKTCIFGLILSLNSVGISKIFELNLRYYFSGVVFENEFATFLKEASLSFWTQHLISELYQHYNKPFTPIETNGVKFEYLKDWRGTGYFLKVLDRTESFTIKNFQFTQMAKGKSFSDYIYNDARVKADGKSYIYFNEHLPSHVTPEVFKLIFGNGPLWYDYAILNKATYCVNSRGHSCKEQAMLYFLMRETESFTVNELYTDEELDWLKEIQVNVKPENRFVILKHEEVIHVTIPKWWREACSYYRVGFVFLALRIANKREKLSPLRLQNAFDAFVNGKFECENYHSWSHSINWRAIFN